jgi:hypothetical protein
MPDVQEVFRMATQKVKPEPGALERQFQGQRRRARNRRIGGFVAGGIIVVAAVVLGVVLLNGGGNGNPQPAISQSAHPSAVPSATVAPPAPAFALGDVATLWSEKGGSHLLSIKSDGTYAIDDAGLIDTAPADVGTVAVVGKTLVFTSTGGTACGSGQAFTFDPLRLSRQSGVVIRMASSTTSGATCAAAPAGDAVWENVPYRNVSFPFFPEGSGRDVTAADETGVFALVGDSVITRQSADGQFVSYDSGNLEGPPDNSGTWEVRPGGKLVWTFATDEPDLGCKAGQTIIYHDQVVRPGVIAETFTGGTCPQGPGQGTIVRLSPR